jgi:hypothetical protein
MSVFKIQIHRQPEKPAEQKAEDVNAQTLEGEELSEQPTDVKSAEVPAETVGGPLNIAESSEAEKEEKEQDNPKDKTVRIDGPVSRIFTHALNQLLATESYMMTMVEDPAEEKQAAEEFPEIQVYCWSGNVLNSEDITKLYNEVTCHTDRQFILAVESSNGLSNNVKMLDVIDRLPNLTICYTQKQAINAVRSKLQ